MANQFALNFLGVEWEIKLLDCVDKTNFNVTDVSDQQIVFYKPDGTQLIKQALLVEDPDNAEIKYIKYRNTAPETKSILDLLGKWEFAGMVQLLSNDSFQTSQRSIFWVV